MADEGPDLLSTGLRLSFRIPILAVFGLFLFATNLTLLHAVGIPVERLIGSDHGATGQGSLIQRSNACYIFTILATGVLLSGIAGAQITDSQFVPLATCAALALLLFAPARLRLIPYATERKRFLSLLGRICLGGIRFDEPGGRFLDILVADVLTSYARVFGDLCALLLACLHETGHAQGTVLGNAAIAAAVSVPYWIRLRQCLILLAHTRERSHLFNAIKYATAFPVIFLSALSATGIGQGEGDVIGGVTGSFISHGSLRTTWIIACVVNSVYSLYWDLCKDWDLFVGDKAAPRPFGRLLSFPSFIYVFCILADFALRFVWLAKFQPQSVVARWDYRFQYAEVIRRWLWLFLRIECEHVRNNAGGGAVRLPLTELALDERGGVAFTMHDGEQQYSSGSRRGSDREPVSWMAGKVDQD